jgi:hypothetical protein
MVLFSPFPFAFFWSSRHAVSGKAYGKSAIMRSFSLYKSNHLKAIIVLGFRSLTLRHLSLFF